MSPAGAAAASRVLVVGQDADVSIALHLHLERAGFAVYLRARPARRGGDRARRGAARHRAHPPRRARRHLGRRAHHRAERRARSGVRVVMVAPSREVVEPLAAVAGAERASRAGGRPRAAARRGGARASARGLVGGQAPRRPAAARPRPRRRARPPRARAREPGPPPPPARPAGRPASTSWRSSTRSWSTSRRRARSPTRVEVNVSLVSEHNFYVGPHAPDGLGRRLHRDRHAAAGGDAAPGPARPRRRAQDRPRRRGRLRAREERHHRPPADRLRRAARRPCPGWAVDAIERFILARQPIVYTPL